MSYVVLITTYCVKEVSIMQITIREPGSAITHFIAMMLTVFAAAPLLVKSALSDTANMLPAMTIFILSMVLL